MNFNNNNLLNQNYMNNKSKNNTEAKNSKKSSNEIKSQEKKVINSDKEKIQIPQFVALESTLGAISLLAMKSQSHKYLFTADLEWLVVPAVAQKQFRLFRNNKNEPVAFVSWANIDDEIEARLLSGSLKLQPRDWNGGKKKYIIDIISPFIAVREVLKELKENHLKDEEVYLYCRSGNRSGQAALILETMGFTNVTNVVGGMLAWKDSFGV